MVRGDPGGDAARRRTSRSTTCSPRIPRASYVAYVSQQNLVPDDSDEPIDHPAIGSLFDRFDEGRYLLRREHRH